MPIVAVVSGGLDSTVLAYQARKLDPETHLISFDYGQRHKRELEFAARTAAKLGLPHKIVDISNIGRQLLYDSALTNPAYVVPHGHYEAPNMAQTVVPNRNAIMLSIAFGWAVSIGARRVGIAVHSGDHAIYPDCRPSFITAFSLMEALATEGYSEPGLAVWAPYVTHSKAGIVEIGYDLDVPFEDTWSCYEGREMHCGRCGTCVERKEAFRLAKVIDPTEYVDEIYEVLAYRG